MADHIPRWRITVLLSALLSTGMTMASSLTLLSASDLAGSWTLQQGQEPSQCQLQLLATPVEQANGYALGGDLSCLKQWLSSDAQAWRPTPDGIALLEGEGLTLLFLANQGQGLYQAQHRSAGTFQLRRD